MQGIKVKRTVRSESKKILAYHYRCQSTTCCPSTFSKAQKEIARSLTLTTFAFAKLDFLTSPHLSKQTNKLKNNPSYSPVMRFTPLSPLHLDTVRIPDCICITRPFFAEASVSRGKVYRPSHACETIEQRVTGAIGVLSAAEVCCAVL
jgi:hypothetical protein